MKITQITINLFSSNTDSSHKPLQSTSCAIVGITPTTGWTCPHDGTMRWRNPSSPIYIKPYQAYTFLAKVAPGSINGDEPALLISVTAFTSFGQFAKQGYATNMFNSPPASIMNIYLTDTANNVTALVDSPTNHILGNITLQNGETNKRIYVAVADFETSNNAASKMLTGATLIINVPKNFTQITIPISIPGFDSVNKTQYSDGTTQIRARINTDVGDVVGKEAAVFYFDVKAPTVVQTRTYVMHTFLEGLINTSPQFEADAFGTFGLVVCYTPAC